MLCNDSEVYRIIHGLGAYDAVQTKETNRGTKGKVPLCTQFRIQVTLEKPVLHL